MWSGALRTASAVDRSMPFFTIVPASRGIPSHQCAVIWLTVPWPYVMAGTRCQSRLAKPCLLTHRFQVVFRAALGSHLHTSLRCVRMQRRRSRRFRLRGYAVTVVLLLACSLGQHRRPPVLASLSAAARTVRADVGLPLAMRTIQALSCLSVFRRSDCQRAAQRLSAMTA